MAQALKRKGSSRREVRQAASSVEGTALVSLHAIGGKDMARIAKALKSAGVSGIRPTKIILSRSAARRLALGQRTAVQATIVPAEAMEVAGDEAVQDDLIGALDAAKARGDALKQDLLGDPDMLGTAEMARRLGMSQEGVRLKRKRYEVLGLELAKRGIRYPAWQIFDHQQVLPGLPHLFGILGDSPWTIYRFLLQHHPELGGARALDALRHGRIDAVIAAAENIASGSFA